MSDPPNNDVQKSKYLTLEEQREIIGNLTGFNNPHLQEYHDFVAQCARENTGPCLLGDEYFHVGMLNTLGINNLIKGKPLVDIGGGDIQTSYNAASWAEGNGASIYIDVDRCLTISDADLEPDAIGRDRDTRTVDDEKLGPLVTVEAEQKFSIPTIYIADDILDFLARLESGSVNISISGIADEVVGNEKHSKFLANEIARIISGGGCCVWIKHRSSLQSDATKKGCEDDKL